VKRKEEKMMAIVFAVVGVIGGVFTAITEGRNLVEILKDRKK
jgi:hypothetical protein